MHACGHDGHVAMTLGAARGARRRCATAGGAGCASASSPPRRSPRGAVPMIDDGALDGVDQVLGIHLWAPLQVGQVGVKDGPIFGSADEFGHHRPRPRRPRRHAPHQHRPGRRRRARGAGAADHRQPRDLAVLAGGGHRRPRRGRHAPSTSSPTRCACAAPSAPSTPTSASGCCAGSPRWPRRSRRRPGASARVRARRGLPAGDQRRRVGGGRAPRRGRHRRRGQRGRHRSRSPSATTSPASSTRPAAAATSWSAPATSPAHAVAPHHSADFDIDERCLPDRRGHAGARRARGAAVSDPWARLRAERARQYSEPLDMTPRPPSASRTEISTVMQIAAGQQRRQRPRRLDHAAGRRGRRHRRHAPLARAAW